MPHLGPHWRVSRPCSHSVQAQPPPARHPRGLSPPIIRLDAGRVLGVLVNICTRLGGVGLTVIRADLEGVGGRARFQQTLARLMGGLWASAGILGGDGAAGGVIRDPPQSGGLPCQKRESRLSVRCDRPWRSEAPERGPLVSPGLEALTALGPGGRPFLFLSCLCRGANAALD